VTWPSTPKKFLQLRPCKLNFAKKIQKSTQLGAFGLQNYCLESCIVTVAKTVETCLETSVESRNHNFFIRFLLLISILQVPKADKVPFWLKDQYRIRRKIRGSIPRSVNCVFESTSRSDRSQCRMAFRKGISEKFSFESRKWNPEVTYIKAFIKVHNRNPKDLWYK